MLLGRGGAPSCGGGLLLHPDLVVASDEAEGGVVAGGKEVVRHEAVARSLYGLQQLTCPPHNLPLLGVAPVAGHEVGGLRDVVDEQVGAGGRRGLALWDGQGGCQWGQRGPAVQRQWRQRDDSAVTECVAELGGPWLFLELMGKS
jgi:hypothetical protein